jgi:hypothetical protein
MLIRARIHSCACIVHRCSHVGSSTHISASMYTAQMLTCWFEHAYICQHVYCTYFHMLVRARIHLPACILLIFSHVGSSTHTSACMYTAQMLTCSFFVQDVGEQGSCRPVFQARRKGQGRIRTACAEVCSEKYGRLSTHGVCRGVLREVWKIEYTWRVWSCAQRSMEDWVHMACAEVCSEKYGRLMPRAVHYCHSHNNWGPRNGF